MTTKALWWIGGVAAALLAYNATVTIPVSRALSDEKDITAVAYRSWLVSPDAIVFDIWRTTPEASMVKVDRALFLAASALKNSDYTSVALAYHGHRKLLLDGARFKAIGMEWPDQNPVYVIRTMQADIKTLDGEPAFETWTGGWLGVLGKEFEQHNDLHKRWWVRDALGLPADAPLNEATP